MSARDTATGGDAALAPATYRLPSVPLLVRVVLALAAVGLLPFAISAYQIRSSRAAIVDQAQLTHKTAARAMADRVAAYLELLAGTTESAARNPNLYGDPSSPAAEAVLTALLEARSELIGAGVYLESRAAPTLVQMAQRKDQRAALERALELGDAREVVATRSPGGLWLRVRSPLDRAPLARPEDQLTLILVTDATSLIETFLPAELGDEADLALADHGARVLAGNVESLRGFPPEFVEIARANQLASAAGEYRIGDGEPVVAAFADVPGVSWFVASKQPSRVAESVSSSLRKIAWRAFAGALLLTALLSAGAHASIVRPIRRLVRAQRELAGFGATSGHGDEIEQLEEAFASLERNLHDREALNQVFLDRYRVVDVLGAGAMGTVFRGWDPKLERAVALKTLKIGADLPPEERHKLTERLLKEAITLARLQHAHIVTVFDVVRRGDVAFIAMELVEGMGLDAYLHHVTRLPQDQVVTLGVALLSALETAHRAGFVHHDVKPANILLGSDGSIKFTDFGVSELLTSVHQQQGDFVCGTPGYLAPEALLGEPYTVKSDLFALGVVLYQCSTGERPFQGATLKETLIQTVAADVSSPRGACPDIPEEVEGLILDLLEKEPADRPQDAHSAGQVLEKLAARRGWRWQPPSFRKRVDVREGTYDTRQDHLSVLPTSTVYR